MSGAFGVSPTDGLIGIMDWVPSQSPNERGVRCELPSRRRPLLPYRSMSQSPNERGVRCEKDPKGNSGWGEHGLSQSPNERGVRCEIIGHSPTRSQSRRVAIP